MIIVQATSGTGNQLFQYAAARALSLTNGETLCVDALAFLARPHANVNVEARDFILGDLNLPIRVIGREAAFWHGWRGAMRLRNAWLGLGLQVYRCESLWQPNFDRLGRSLLQGYFQDQRYFAAHANTVLREVDQALSTLATQTHSQASDADAALHVRRSDYLHHAGTDTGWFEHYYERALKTLRDAGAKRIAIYSDDPNWCQQAFTGYEAIEVMPVDPRHGGLLDLWRLSQHARIALCNSTFSWWAARVATERGAQIIAPSRWAQWCADPEAALMQPSWQRL
ncbi:hypothetical protein C7S18_23070 [Ahniella affigens]|uniref:Alpha-1,2-fucosyltransferase n=1 Tax=Ahniella affigens TaxID=2021234 RepID=A0A2P1PYG5_9GAMM|nr:hypothetical protein C7S18_23070 [Ahniella affigens]